MDAFINDFHFLRPLWLLALVPALILASLLWRSYYSSQQWHKHISPALLPSLLQGGVNRKSGFLLVGILICWLAACIALAGPVWQKQPSPVVQNTDALVICWDLSPSMMAQDISPSRLVRSRLKIIDLLKARPDGQTALIAFSGEAYTVTPLTDDSQTIINLLPALAPNTLPSLGSNPEMAYSNARELLTQAGIAKGQILMITDEITTDALTTLQDMVGTSPHQLTLWGLGTADGAPVPWGKQGFARDNSGAIAMAKLNEDELRAFAVKTNSFYVPMVSDSSDINALKSLLNRQPSNDPAEASEQLFDQWLENGHYFIWLCLPLLLVGFRRGWLMSIAIIMLPFSLSTAPAEASAFKTDDQKGFEAYQQKNYENAAKQFTNPNWQGAAHYQNGNYSEAAKAFSQLNTASAKFNQGNAELLQGNFEQAISAYEQAQKLDPNLEGVEKNKQLAKALKKQKQEQEKQQEQNSDSDKQNDQDGEKNQDQQSSKQPSDSQESDNTESDNTESDNKESDNQEQSHSSANNASSSQSGQAGEQSSEASSSSAQAAQNDQASEQSTSDQSIQEQSSSLSAAQMAEAAEQPMTEEQQKLETFLRKVPDDPSGLLRAKFQQQYRQRQQELRSGGSFNDTQKAEKRW